MVELNENLNDVNIPHLCQVKEEWGPWSRALQELLQRGYAYQKEHQFDEVEYHAMQEVNPAGFEHTYMEHEEYLLSSSDSSLRVDCTLGGFDINYLNFSVAFLNLWNL